MSRLRSGKSVGDELAFELVEKPLARDRTWYARLWYEMIRLPSFVLLTALSDFRAGGRHHIPATGGALLISNHVSYLDVFVLGLSFPRPLNYVARSTLFVPILGPLIRWGGGFPINREGMGASGLKETLRRLRKGGIVLLFPEGTRSADGRLMDLKSGISVLARKARVPIIPAAIAGTFDAWPRDQWLPRPHSLRIEYGPAIDPAVIADLPSEDLTRLLQERLLDCHRLALLSLAWDRGIEPPGTDSLPEPKMELPEGR
ncbi:MAG: hypothetical protein NVSMB9_01080 [Isosphaeraceae bacterium]